MAKTPRYIYEGVLSDQQWNILSDLKTFLERNYTIVKDTKQLVTDLNNTVEETGKKTKEFSLKDERKTEAYQEEQRKTQILGAFLEGISKTIEQIGVLATRAAEYEMALTNISHRMIAPIQQMNSIYNPNGVGTLENITANLNRDTSKPWTSTTLQEMVGFSDIFLQYGKLRQDTMGQGFETGVTQLAQVAKSSARGRGLDPMEAAATAMQYNVFGVDMDKLPDFTKKLGDMARIGALTSKQVLSIDKSIRTLARTFDMSSDQITKFGTEYMKVAGIISLVGGNPADLQAKMQAYSTGSEQGMLNALILGYDTNSPNQMLGANQGAAQNLLSMLNGVPEAMKAYVAQQMAAPMGLGGMNLKDIQDLAATGKASTQEKVEDLTAKIADNSDKYVAVAERVAGGVNRLSMQMMGLGKGLLSGFDKIFSNYAHSLLDKFGSITGFFGKHAGLLVGALTAINTLPGLIMLLIKSNSSGGLGDLLGGGKGWAAKLARFAKVSGTGIIGGLLAAEGARLFLGVDKEEEIAGDSARKQLSDNQYILSRINRQLSSGKQPNGTPLSEEQIEKLKAQREKIQNNIEIAEGDVKYSDRSFWEKRKEMYNPENMSLGWVVGESQQLGYSNSYANAAPTATQYGFGSTNLNAEFNNFTNDYNGGINRNTSNINAYFRDKILIPYLENTYGITSTGAQNIASEHGKGSWHPLNRALDANGVKELLKTSEGRKTLSAAIDDLKYKKGISKTFLELPDISVAKDWTEFSKGQIQQGGTGAHIHTQWRDLSENPDILKAFGVKQGIPEGTTMEDVIAAETAKAENMASQRLVVSSTGGIKLGSSSSSEALAAAKQQAARVTGAMTPQGAATEAAEASGQESAVHDAKAYGVLLAILSAVRGENIPPMLRNKDITSNAAMTHLNYSFAGGSSVNM